jgi:hypothetical protein
MRGGEGMRILNALEGAVRTSCSHDRHLFPVELRSGARVPKEAGSLPRGGGTAEEKQ